MIKKVVPVLILLLFGLFSPLEVSAHSGGGPPFLQVNGVYSQTNPYWQGDSTMNIPQDIGPKDYLPNQQITLHVITSQLLVPKDIADASTFRWTFFRGQNFDQPEFQTETGQAINVTYDTLGSHLVNLEVKAPGEDQYQLIDTVQLDIVPDLSYQRPKFSVYIGSDSWQINTPVKFESIATFHPQNTHATFMWDFGEQNIEQGQQVTHTYSSQNLLSYVYARVVDDQGLSSTIGFNSRIVDGKISFPPFGNMLSAPVKTGPYSGGSGDQTTTGQTNKGSSFLILIGAAAIIIVAITSFILLLRKK